MEPNNDNIQEGETEEEVSEQVFDLWSDEGARVINERLDEGSAYVSADVRVFQDFHEYAEYQTCEYSDPEYRDPEEETLPPGEMELIFENCYVM